MVPEAGSIQKITQEQNEFYSSDVALAGTKLRIFAERMKNSSVGLSLDSYNYIILCATLACCMRPRIFTSLVVNTSVRGFIIQYPICVAIFGIITAAGLDKIIA